MKLVIGLGNPGKKYENTRHNIGFNVIDNLAKDLGVENFREKFQGLIAEVNFRSEKVLLLKPQTYMNLSGNSVIEVVNFYKLDVETDIIVIYDDMDLKLGELRIKAKGSAGGHNGIKSIISHIGDKFIRVKCGIGKPKEKGEVVNFVLNNFAKSEMEEVDNLIENAKNATKDILIAKSLDRVMQKHNRKK
ncbi:MAG: peptidyl-tRNA hydrolase, family [Fusobacteriaceae bacterium]|jgi:PTH1 family peptidyl-tRNA hydrolase|nr:peptidyl-tRNA hydrolase [Fusobacteriales bacterium]MDN5303877.1 peptidyl-tRNA hydrolase, family [Fusobacteriaceae bacterium]